MRKLRKWILVLGVMATAPAVGLAGPFSLPLNPFKTEKTTSDTQKVSNKQIADKVAAALRSAHLQGKQVAIEVDNGVATLSGSVTDAAEKEKATKVAEQVAGIKKVDNQLAIKLPIRQMTPSLKQASFFQRAGESRFGGIRRVSEEQPAAPSAPPTNQETAERIAAAMGAAGLDGYDIQIGFQNGTAQLSGQVTDASQRALAESVTSQVPGVQNVANRLTVPVARRRGPAMPPQSNNSRQLAAQQQQMYAQMAYQAQVAQAQAQAAQGYGMPSAAGTQIAHNSPNLPQFAYPSYAAYPNYAAVSYPKQYSASAWPYIGPFYPYPQVPMGWRQATLEWDDGAWNLKFDTKTDKWWWFLHPKNW